MNRNAAAALALVALSVLLVAASSSAASPGSLTVHFIDVGQGDSALLRDSLGTDVLIDGGKPGAGPTVVAYLRRQAVDDVDVLVVTHADADHTGGLIEVLQASDIPVEQVLYNGYPGDTATWDTLSTAVAADGLAFTPAQFPQTFIWGETTAHILNPAPGLVDPETNDVSLVALVEHGDNGFLFTGDIDSAVEATVVARGTPVAAEVLKVAHHGSAGSSGAAFLAAVDPQVAVISVGENSYGHPAGETLSRLEMEGAGVLRTDLQGTVVLASDGLSVQVQGLPPAYGLYLPLLSRAQAAQPTPVPPTATPQPSAIPTATPTTPAPAPATPGAPAPTATPQPGGSGSLVISGIFYDGVQGRSEPDEYVEIRNEGAQAVQLQGWTLRDAASPPKVFTFPGFLMQPGQSCRVYTNETHPESCGFSFGNGSAIWNNGGDCAYLRDGEGRLVDEYCY